MHVDGRSRDQVYEAAGRREQTAQRPQQAELARRRGDVVEGEGRQDEVELGHRQGAQVAVADKLVATVWIQSSGTIEHGGRDVDAEYVVSQDPQESRRAAGAATEVQRGSARDVLAQQRGKVAKR